MARRRRARERAHPEVRERVRAGANAARRLLGVAPFMCGTPGSAAVPGTLAVAPFGDADPEERLLQGGSGGR